VLNASRANLGRNVEQTLQSGWFRQVRDAWFWNLNTGPDYRQNFTPFSG